MRVSAIRVRHPTIRCPMNLIDTFRRTLRSRSTLAHSKMRSALTILGVVIGVSYVMAMASIVHGIQRPDRAHDRDRRADDVLRDEGLLADAAQSGEPAQVGAHPPGAVRGRRASASRRCRKSSTRRSGGRSSTGSSTAARVRDWRLITGADDGYPEIYGGELVRRPLVHQVRDGERRGRRRARERRGHQAVRQHPADRQDASAIGGRPAKVIGIYQAAANIFEPPGQEQFARSSRSRCWTISSRSTRRTRCSSR